MGGANFRLWKKLEIEKGTKAKVERMFQRVNSPWRGKQRSPSCPLCAALSTALEEITSGTSKMTLHLLTGA